MTDFKAGDIVVIKTEWLADYEDPNQEYIVTEVYGNGRINIYTKSDVGYFGTTNTVDEKMVKKIGYIKNGKPKYLNKDKLEDELWCMSMIESTIAYNWVEGMNGEELVKRSGYLDSYISELGKSRVVELANDLIDNVDHIQYSVYTDSEGLSYNSIVWKDLR